VKGKVDLMRNETAVADFMVIFQNVSGSSKVNHEEFL
jgi:hypothetical protein